MAMNPSAQELIVSDSPRVDGGHKVLIPTSFKLRINGLDPGHSERGPQMVHKLCQFYSKRSIKIKSKHCCSIQVQA